AVNSVIALFYYARVAGMMWFRPAPAEQGTAGVPVALGAAIALPPALILAIGVYPNLFARLGDLATQGPPIAASGPIRADPDLAGALRYVLVERSAGLRAAQAEHLPLEPAELVLGPAVPPEPGEEPVTVPGSGPVVTALEELPAGPAVGVIVANELADNLPIRIVERTPGGWNEIRVSEADGRFAEIVMPADDGLAAVADRLAEGHDIPVGARLPIPSALFEWLRSAGAMLRRGFVAIIDYAAPVEVLAARGQS